MPGPTERLPPWVIVALGGVIPGSGATVGPPIGVVAGRIATLRAEITAVGFVTGSGSGTATKPPVGATVPEPATWGIAAVALAIEVVFSAWETSPGRADTARAFKDRNTAPTRSSIPIAVIGLVM